MIQKSELSLGIDEPSDWTGLKCSFILGTSQVENYSWLFLGAFWDPFSRACHRLHVLASNSDWFISSTAFVVIGQIWLLWVWFKDWYVSHYLFEKCYNLQDNKKVFKLHVIALDCFPLIEVLFYVYTVWSAIHKLKSRRSVIFPRQKRSPK